MKKDRVIVLRGHFFQNLRNQLRNVLKLWLSDFQIELMKLDSNFWRLGEIVNAREIQQRMKELRLKELDSILTCPYCGRSDKNMVHISKLGQWLCIDCYAEILHYENLRKNLDMTKGEIREFFERLTGEEGIAILPRGSRCHEFHYSRLILERMGIPFGTQEQFFELCKYYGGYCDCEIALNVKDSFKIK